MILAAFIYLIGAIGVAAYIHFDGNPLGLAWPFLALLSVVVGILLAFERLDRWMDKR